MSYTREQKAAKLKEIMASLPEDKRQMLYNRLMSLKSEEREVAIDNLISKFESRPVITKEPEPPQASPVRTEKSKKSKKNKLNTKKLFTFVISGILVVSIIILGIKIIGKTIKIGQDTANVSETSLEETEPSVTPTPEPTSTPTPSPTPAPTVVPLAADAPDLSGLVVVLDPGHQEVTDYDTESTSSWGSTTKPRCTSGTTGVVSGITEYELTLQYALIARDYLEQCGATVILTRTENNVNISNQERAQIAVDNNADVFIRLHADSANDSAQSGVRVFVPDSGSFTANAQTNGEELAQLVADRLGLEVDSVRSTSLYTGLNYANSVPAFQISLGFLSNSDDEAVLINEENTRNVAIALSEFCAIYNQ